MRLPSMREKPPRVETHNAPSGAYTSAITMSSIRPSLRESRSTPATLPSASSESRSSPPPAVPTNTDPSGASSKALT
jgi:hypothetical protein